MVVQLTISLCTVAVRLFAITYLDNKNSRKRERMWIYLHTYDIIPSLTVGKQKNGCKASKINACSRFLFRNDMCYCAIFFTLG